MSQSAEPMVRRRPAQARSRERVDRILAAAAELIADKGSDQVKMSEIAARSGMSLASLYQYFPDKPAIVARLAERHNDASRECIAAAFADVVDGAGLDRAFRALMAQYLAVVRAEPVMRDIWSGMQADKGLAALQAAETRRCAALLGDTLARAHPRGDRAAIDRIGLLVWELGEAAVRLSLTLDDAEADALVAAYTRMALRELGELAG